MPIRFTGDVKRIHGRREFFSSKIDECFILTLEKHLFRDGSTFTTYKNGGLRETSPRPTTVLQSGCDKINLM